MIDIKRFIFETTEDWKSFRKGLFTSSRINELMATPRSKEKVLSDGAMSYIYDLVSSEIAEPKPDYYSAEMEWGNTQEPQAVLKFAELYGYDVNADNFIYTSVGGFVFFVMDEIAGGTPDIILPDAIVEIKCPNPDTHLYYLNEVTSENISKEVPKYYDQMQLNMLLTGKSKAYFMSYDPRYKNEKLQYHIVEVMADSERQEKIIEKIKLANEVKTQILKKYGNNN